MPGPRPKAEPAAAWHALAPDQALERLRTGRDGLSAAEAEARLSRHGPNALQTTPAVSAWRILLAQLRGVVVWLLIAAAAVALLMGDRAEAAAIAVVLILNALLGFVMELRANRAMEALLSLEVPRAVVVRDGRRREIDAREVVPGDVLALEAGAMVPADAYLLDARELVTRESALTGESLPVHKRSGEALPAPTSLAERTNLVFRSTFAATGTGRAVVYATGMGTEVGKIGTLVAGVADEPTPLERRLDDLGRRLVWVALAAAAAVAFLGWLQGVALAETLETGIALAIAAVPEGLPAVATIALAVGVRRMARRHALIRRLPVVESLGSATIVCTDKTGTLTRGEMTVTELRAPGRRWTVTGVGYAPEGGVMEGDSSAESSADPVLRRLLTAAVLANNAELLEVEGAWAVRGDPTEGALLAAAAKAGIERHELLAETPEVGEVPFSSERMLMATFHRRADGSVFAAVKGAPGRLLERCTRTLFSDGERPLESDERRALRAENEEMASHGLRVLAMAWKEGAESAGPDALRDLVFLGFAGMMDPPAEGVPETIRTLRDAGIRTVMITGDQRATAEAVGRELGIVAGGEQVFDGAALSALEGDEWLECVRQAGAFSRVSPEDKLRLVEGYRQAGEIVAMLGDGVNDAAALRRADVGVAMGIRGTDVAKEAASVVLQDDRFATVAAAVEEGRVVYANIRRFVFYLFSCNVAEVLVLLLCGLAGLPAPLGPLPILWMNLVTDTFPALALAMEPADGDVMRHPPHDPRAAILSRAFLGRIALYGLMITACALAAYLIALRTVPLEHARTVAFQTLSLAQVFHLGNARSTAPVLSREAITRNRWALAAVLGVIVLQLAAAYLQPIPSILRVAVPDLRDWLLILPFSVAPAVVGQVMKLLRVRAAAVAAE
ncbi:cation-transporting P-type ATPase [Longimicrobium sp.]|uniref:cation-translocating P-type ATPase n=1 Tax=Longimicrobium sp. TaxID=2029185 RepID=UPI002B685EEB|nr:cation-transporting P-type ATPase [Longimicrobium sp.]HSU16083.1 cation-transporting P-type ATPase [Longimicrobium sp.]